MPLVPSSAWSAVAQAETILGVATFSGNRRPPMKIHHELWPLIPISGDEGARSLLRLRPDLIHEIPCDGNPVDIDRTTPYSAMVRNYNPLESVLYG